jgi:hypothetical protein
MTEREWDALGLAIGRTMVIGGTLLLAFSLYMMAVTA